MARHKMKDEDKKVSFGITIHPELAKLIEEESKNKNIPISQIIESVMKKHFEKQ